MKDAAPTTHCHFCFGMKWSGAEVALLSLLSATAAGSDHMVIVDFIGRTEAMAKVEAYLSETLGRRIAIGHGNASSERRDYREFYNERSLTDRVGDVYERLTSETH